jgi:diadenosine tetraphosphatase ApaH/serine/threonine PP2A family protein phosphatase
LVGIYTSPNECVAELDRNQVICIAGNHDRAAIRRYEPDRFSPIAREALYWTRENLTEETASFLSSLPLSRVIENSLMLVHGALSPIPNELERLNSSETATLSFQAMERNHPEIRLCFFGHIHLPLVYEWREGRVVLHTGKSVKLRPDSRYLINPGSVGHPRDGDPRSSFAIYDEETSTIQFYRTAYDVLSCRKKLDSNGIRYYHPAGFLPPTNRVVIGWNRLLYFLYTRFHYLFP